MIDWNDFSKVDMRVGTIIEAEVFEEVKKPALKIKIDFGPEIGIKKTSAQIRALYEPKDIIGKQVIGVVNFPPKQIASIMSEVLLLGALGDGQDVILLTTDKPVKNGLPVS
ncbi:tRNA-binding protein [Flammeovirga agarivorans]|uniref:tRNA-binding protein n=1 Tax=Flammeovirga agarivorans TaxID=2726742 RepID=A0A7X8SPV6_9BACT|nr:tRNA-binding protein [Flammeovirga agarivorans]NLR94148.1 tRNA-binding protein [Flammeovirga agarivorans]